MIRSFRLAPRAPSRLVPLALAAGLALAAPWVGAVGAAAPPAVAASAPGVGERHDAAFNAVRTAAYVVVRIGEECLDRLHRVETLEHFTGVWDGRHEVLLDAAWRYQTARQREAEQQGGRARVDAVMGQLRGVIRAEGEATVRSLLDRPDRTAACRRAVDLIEAGGFDLTTEHPMQDELRDLTVWAKARR